MALANHRPAKWAPLKYRLNPPCQACRVTLGRISGELQPCRNRMCERYRLSPVGQIAEALHGKKAA